MRLRPLSNQILGPTTALTILTVLLALGTDVAIASTVSNPYVRPDFDPVITGEEIRLRSQQAHAGSPRAREAAAGGAVVPVAVGPRLVVQYIAGCSRVVQGDALTMCNDTCPAGTTQQRPLSFLVQPGEVPPTDLTLWQQGRAGCYPPDAGVVDLPGVDPQAVAEMFAALVLPATANVPLLAEGKALVQMPVIVYATVGQRQWPGIPMAGTTVAIRATPSEFTWTFGDGSDPLVTDDPGAWYPNHTISHEYTHAGDYQVALTTTFTGEYSVAGGPWLDIPGTVVTASPPVDTHIVEARAHLIG